jgi:release factor glutamine methyltransferase
VLGVSRSYLWSWPLKEIACAKADHFQALILRRLQGEPLAYLTGVKEFWSLPFIVNRNVLVPRPETEILIEALLRLRGQITHSLKVLDLGTGCGAIALSIAKERSDWEVYGIDRSDMALKVAKENAKNLSLEQVTFFQSDWFSALSTNVNACFFDIIVSNPPYIAENDKHLKEDGVCFEPRDALIAGNDGLRDLQHIINGSVEYLVHEGLLMLEHGSKQAKAVAQMMLLQGFSQITCVKDLAGLDRVTIGTFST